MRYITKANHLRFVSAHKIFISAMCLSLFGLVYFSNYHALYDEMSLTIILRVLAACDLISMFSLLIIQLLEKDI